MAFLYRVLRLASMRLLPMVTLAWPIDAEMPFMAASPREQLSNEDASQASLCHADRRVLALRDRLN
jgi:hypothetical protein